MNHAITAVEGLLKVARHQVERYTRDVEELEQSLERHKDYLEAAIEAAGHYELAVARMKENDDV